MHSDKKGLRPRDYLDVAFVGGTVIFGAYTLVKLAVEWVAEGIFAIRRKHQVK